MTTFFTILIALITINALLLLFSVNRSAPKLKKSESKVLEPSVTKVFPIDIVTSTYKKAI